MSTLDTSSAQFPVSLATLAVETARVFQEDFPGQEPELGWLVEAAAVDAIPDGWREVYFEAVRAALRVAAMPCGTYAEAQEVWAHVNRLGDYAVRTAAYLAAPGVPVSWTVPGTPSPLECWQEQADLGRRQGVLTVREGEAVLVQEGGEVVAPQQAGALETHLGGTVPQPVVESARAAGYSVPRVRSEFDVREELVTFAAKTRRLACLDAVNVPLGGDDRTC